MQNLLCLFGIYWHKPILPFCNTIILYTERCLVGLYISQNLLFSVSKIFHIFAKSVVVWVVTVQRLIIVFKMEESNDVREAIACHHVGIKWGAVLLHPGPTIFETATLVMSHLNYECEKCIYFFDHTIRRLY